VVIIIQPKSHCGRKEARSRDLLSQLSYMMSHGTFLGRRDKLVSFSRGSWPRTARARSKEAREYLGSDLTCRRISALSRSTELESTKTIDENLN
jgi:hypothetical protein